MLTESCIVSVLRPDSTNSDGIFLHELQPIPAVRSTFKKSSINRNCLATSATYVFAAQSAKAVVHVYNLEKCTLETVVPFPERLSSLALIGDFASPSALAIGTETGRLELWEICTGRLIPTPISHLGSISCIAVDCISNFLLTGSEDSHVCVWSIPKLLSFSVDSVNSERGSAYAPIRKFSDHRAPITGLAIGSSSINTPFAISSSKDSTCIVWDYKTGEALRIFLLHSPALSIVADPAERAFYAGLDDGSIQKVNFLQEQSHLNRITLAQNPPGTLIQAPNKQRWQSTTVSKQPILTLDLSFDGTLLLSGHQDGKIHVWDVAKGRWDRTLFDHATSVTNIFISPPIGLANECAEETKSISALKPKLGGPLLENHNNAQESIIPREYQYSAYFAFELVLPRFRNEYGTDDLMSDFEEALNSSIQPRRLFEEGLQALHTLSVGGASSTFSQPIDHAESSKGIKKLQDQLDASRKLCEHTSGHMDKLSKEVQWFRERERSRERMKKLRRMEKAKAAEAMRKKSMGETTDDNDMVGVSGDNEDMQGASSTTEISSHSA